MFEAARRLLASRIRRISRFVGAGLAATGMHHLGIPAQPGGTNAAEVFETIPRCDGSDGVLVGPAPGHPERLVPAGPVGRDELEIWVRAGVVKA